MVKCGSIFSSYSEVKRGLLYSPFTLEEERTQPSKEKITDFGEK